MLTLGSIKREDIIQDFPFLARKYRARRKAIKFFTHCSPDYVFWIFPNGELYDAKTSHKLNTPKGFRHILDDEPDYKGFLRGRVASNYGPQLIVVYCREQTLATDEEKIRQFLTGVEQVPVPVSSSVIVISDNGDIYGTLNDLRERIVDI